MQIVNPLKLKQFYIFPNNPAEMLQSPVALGGQVEAAKSVIA